MSSGCPPLIAMALYPREFEQHSVLDDPSSSTAAKTQFGQWFATGSTGQEFQADPASTRAGRMTPAWRADGAAGASGAEAGAWAELPLAPTRAPVADLRRCRQRSPGPSPRETRRRLERKKARLRQIRRAGAEPAELGRARVSAPASPLSLRWVLSGRVVGGEGRD